ncbi:hypothetical protein CEXT_45251 [Caerostris extrusa]|uniref:Uncharacterized protein n=1 Tax=Caerostris extrusa TaxID=172846 RepID=A0AAV4T7S8_CAEEX|nr:hypothetical protein CEXT_45251 [Caerostris extrusa]
MRKGRGGEGEENGELLFSTTLCCLFTVLKQSFKPSMLKIHRQGINNKEHQIWSLVLHRSQKETYLRSFFSNSPISLPGGVWKKKVRQRRPGAFHYATLTHEKKFSSDNTPLKNPKTLGSPVDVRIWGIWP